MYSVPSIYKAMVFCYCNNGIWQTTQGDKLVILNQTFNKFLSFANLRTMPERPSPSIEASLAASGATERPPQRFVEITPQAVSVLGVKLERSKEARPRVPPAEKFSTFSEDEFSLNLLQTIAKSAALDQPLLLEGEAAVGKSYTIEYLAHLCNREVYRMSLNGQTDTTDLIGKWVPRTETVRKKIDTLLKHPETCQTDEARRLIEFKTKKQSRGQDEQSEPLVGFTKEEMEAIATAEGIEVPEGDWTWQDGDIPKQMKTGAWSVLDEVNTCEPQILVRLNALLERGGQLVLSEDGSKVVERNPNFRLFATVNPPGGRYKGRIPLSAEWISRWNYQNMGELPKEIRAQRLMAADGVPSPEVKPDKLSRVAPEAVPEERTLADYYGVDWVRDLYTKYAEFADKIREMLRKGEIAKDQTQIFDFDQRDDWRFREYIRKFHESGRIQKTIKEAIAYCFANKCKSAADRRKVMDLVSLINVAEPRALGVAATAVEGDREDLADKLRAAKAELAGMDLPKEHKDLLLGVERRGSDTATPEFVRSAFAALQEKMAERARIRDLVAPRLEMPSTPEGLSAEHLHALADVFGDANMEISAMPSELDDNYFAVMYPNEQSDSDTTSGLTSYLPSFWEERANDEFCISRGEDRPTLGKLFITSMRAEAGDPRFRGKLILTESIQKPNYTDGTQGYGTKDGADRTKDPLAPIIQEVFGEEHNHRFSLSWDQVNTELLPKLKEVIVGKFEERGLSIPNFEVVCTPAIVSNLHTTLNHPENSRTNTYEWSSTSLLKEDNTDSGLRLVVGYSGRGGAGCVGDGPRGGQWSFGAFRLSVVFAE